MTLAEMGPFDKVVVLGPASADAIGRLFVTGAPPLQALRSANVEGRAVEAWFLGPAETLLLVDPAERPGDAAAAQIASRIGDDLSVVDVSSAWTGLRLLGPAAPAVLAELLTVDVDPRSLPAGSLVQGPFAGVRSIVARRETQTDPDYAILVPRDYALYCWDSLLAVGGVHGLVAGPPEAAG